MILDKKTSVILLAGGLGARMQASVPKQFLALNDKPLALHSFEVFLNLPEVDEIVVVCDPEYRNLFKSSLKSIAFALPGDRRQDSLHHGLLTTTPSYDLICIHDAARPFINKELVLKALQAGLEWGAAAIGMPVKFTVKQSTPKNFVKSTLDRSQVWEIQTPQVLHRSILEEGFRYAQQHQLTVTDDVSLAELIGKEVKLVEGSPTNLKITVPEDLIFARHFFNA